MHEDIEEIIEIPEKVEASLDEALTVKGPKGEVRRKFQIPLELKDGKIRLFAKNGTRNQKKMIMTTRAHINNMIKGSLEGYSYVLQIAFIHFPMTVRIEKKEIIIKNFLGESQERRASIHDNVEVKIEGDKIRIFSPDKEAAGQTAANLETATRITNKDRRVFQDGIWIIETPDKKYLE